MDQQHGRMPRISRCDCDFLISAKKKIEQCFLKVFLKTRTSTQDIIRCSRRCAAQLGPALRRPLLPLEAMHLMISYLPDGKRVYTLKVCRASSDLLLPPARAAAPPKGRRSQGFPAPETVAGHIILWRTDTASVHTAAHCCSPVPVLTRRCDFAEEERRRQADRVSAPWCESSPTGNHAQPHTIYNRTVWPDSK